MKIRFPIVRVTLTAALLLLAGCVSNPAYEEGRQLVEAGRMEEGVARLKQSTKDQPQDVEARTQYFRQRELLLDGLLLSADIARRGGRDQEAESLYRKVVGLDPENPHADAGLREIAQARRRKERLAEAEALHRQGDLAAASRQLRSLLVEAPQDRAVKRALDSVRESEERLLPLAEAIKGPFSKPISLELRETPLKSAFEIFSRTAGLNFVLDKDVKGDGKVTIFVRNTTVNEALRLLLVTNQLESKLLNENSVLIYPATAAKGKDYEENVVKTFYLSNADAKQAQTLIRTMLKSKDVFIDEKLNLLVVKDTPDAVRLAERLVESLDLALPEVMLDVEVLEVSRSKLLNLGIDFPDQIGYGRLTPDSTAVTTSSGTTVATTTAFGGVLTPGNIDLKNRGNLTTYIANPGALINLKKQDGDSRLLANPRIRVINKEKAKIHIGDKLPVFTTTATANVGVSASVTYLDVGLKLEVEPTVQLDENVAMKVNLEVSSIVKEVIGPNGALAYQVGTRTANTALRLRDGETQILAGLINDEQRSSAGRVPGLGDLPLLGRLFSNQTDSNNKTEIVLLITPHILRNVDLPANSGPAIAAGTENAVGRPQVYLTQGNTRGVSRSTENGMQMANQQPLAQPSPPESPELAREVNALLNVPASARPGAQVTLTVIVPSNAEGSGSAQLTYDHATFEDGPTQIELVSTGRELRGEVALKVADKAVSGTTMISLASVRAFARGGTSLVVALPPPQEVRIEPGTQ